MKVFDVKMAARAGLGWAGLFSLSGYLAGCGQVWFGLVWFGLVREEGGVLVGWLVALKCFCM